MTICYFTATGNCLYVARRIGGTLRAIPRLMRQERIEIEDDAVGIVAPVYAAEMPMMVKAFLEKARIKTDYFFFIYTYGIKSQGYECKTYTANVEGTEAVLLFESRKRTADMRSRISPTACI